MGSGVRRRRCESWRGLRRPRRSLPHRYNVACERNALAGPPALIRSTPRRRYLVGHSNYTLTGGGNADKVSGVIIGRVRLRHATA